MSSKPLSLDDLSAYERECLLERAAIIEYCGNVPRAEAERQAWQQFKEKRGFEFNESTTSHER